MAKRLFKGVFIVLIGAIFLACGLYLYARYVEPARLRVARLTLESDRIAGSLRIAVIADIHVGSGGMGSARLEKIMAAVAAEKPELVVFLGDLFDNYGRYTGGEEQALAEALGPEALRGVPKYAVYGNHDLGGRAKAAYRALMEQAGWTVLVNQRAEVGPVNLIGSDDAIFGAPNVAPLVREGAFNLLLAHEPDIARQLGGIDLQLSGHTHGGQVRLPFFGALVLPQWGRHYVRGLYHKEDGGLVYVSGGLGMSTLPFRLGAVPEINIVTLTESAP